MNFLENFIEVAVYRGILDRFSGCKGKGLSHRGMRQPLAKWIDEKEKLSK